MPLQRRHCLRESAYPAVIKFLSISLLTQFDVYVIPSVEFDG